MGNQTNSTNASSKHQQTIGTATTEEGVGEVGSRARRLDIDALRCLIGLTAALLGTWLLNRYLFPSFTAVFPLAREASTVSALMTLTAVALLTTTLPSLMKPRRLAYLTCGAFFAGLAGVAAGLSFSSPPLLTLGGAVMSASRSILTLYACVALTTLTPVAAAPTIAAAALATYVLRTIISVAPPEIGLVTFAASPLVLLGAVGKLAAQPLTYAATCPAASDLALTEPRSFLPFAHVLFAAFFVFRVAWGFSLTLSSVEGMPPTTVLALLPIGAVGIYALAIRKAASADVLYRISSMLILAGFLAALVPHFDSKLLESLPNTLLEAGSDCFFILFYYSLAVIGRRNKINALPAFAWGLAASSAGTLMGTTLGHLVNNLLTSSPSLAPVSIAIAAFLFAVFNQCALHTFSFDRTINGVEPVVLVNSPVPYRGITANHFASSGESDREDHTIHSVPDLLESQCAAIAERYGLTDRETEVFRLLARGRNVPFIEEELVISRNTIKTHIKHIYQKMSVHSQQELIDMAELG